MTCATKRSVHQAQSLAVMPRRATTELKKALAAALVELAPAKATARRKYSRAAVDDALQNTLMVLLTRPLAEIRGETVGRFLKTVLHNHLVNQVRGDCKVIYGVTFHN